MKCLVPFSSAAIPDRQDNKNTWDLEWYSPGQLEEFTLLKKGYWVVQSHCVV